MKVLLFFHGGSKNRGCEAIVRTAVRLLRTNPKITSIGLASGDPESDKIIPGIDEIYLDKRAIIQKYSFAGLRSALNVKFFKDESFAFQIIHESVIKLIPKFDIFLSIGGDNYCYGEQPGMYEINRQIKKACKKLVLWGASIGEEDLSAEKIKDLKTFDLILARESLTEKILKSAGLENVKLVADGAFLMERSELPLPQKWVVGKTLGFNFSPLVFKKNPKSKEAAFALIQHIIQTTDFVICLLPHVMITGNDDHKILLEFTEKFKATNRMFLLPNNLNATEYKGFIARMKFFVGARTHATIAAYSSEIPTMVLGYSIKSKGIAKDIFDEETLVLDLAEISDAQKLITKFEEMKVGEAKLKIKLAERIPKIKAMAKKAGEELTEIL